MENPFLDIDPKNLIDITKALVDFSSFSKEEKQICDALHDWISKVRPDAKFVRVSNTLIVQVNHGESSSSELPIMLAGHLDTVPSAIYEGEINTKAQLVDDKIYGLGTTDMKSGLAVMISLLVDISVPSTFVFYEAEEIGDIFNGLRIVVEKDPELLACKWAILLEPTNGQIELGCQGSLNARVRFNGKRAHSARPWMGENAIHRGAPVLERIVAQSNSQADVVIGDLTYPPTLQVTQIGGGVASNVIPGSFEFVINHRFTPDTSGDSAQAYIASICESADEVEYISITEGAMPALDHPLVHFARSKDRELVPKVAWTDVARFYSLDIPAVNCGPGDANLAHTPGEYVEVQKLNETYEFLNEFIKTL